MGIESINFSESTENNYKRAKDLIKLWNSEKNRAKAMEGTAFMENTLKSGQRKVEKGLDSLDPEETLQLIASRKVEIEEEYKNLVDATGKHTDFATESMRKIEMQALREIEEAISKRMAA